VATGSRKAGYFSEAAALREMVRNRAVGGGGGGLGSRENCFIYEQLNEPS